MTMFYYLLLFAALVVSTQANSCLPLSKKLTRYDINLPHSQLPNQGPLRLCPGLTSTQCCAQAYEDRFQNVSALELYRLFELSTINLYEPLLRLSNDFNHTFITLIDQSRNETHLVLQRGYNKLYQSYQSSIDRFFNQLLTLSSRTYARELKTHVEQLFQSILHISLTLNDGKAISPTYFACLWKNQPFSNHPSLLEKLLETNLAKLFHLHELLRLSHELVQVLSTSVTTDYQCVDAYAQLALCNLCGGRSELPCLASCTSVIESCLANVTLIDDVWTSFLDAMENADYFDSIEKVLASIGLSISDAVMTFFNSGGVQNKDIIDQCGHIRVRRQTPAIDHKADDELSRTVSLSLLDRQLSQIRRSLHAYRPFWTRFPEQICRSTGISAPNGTTCWTGGSLSEDGRSSARAQLDKPLNLKLQWILKEMKENAQLIGHTRRTTSVMHINPTTFTTMVNDSKMNFTDPLHAHDLDDYPNDAEFDYSDYAYEDSTDATSTALSSTTTTTTTTTTTSTTTTTTLQNAHDDDDKSGDDTKSAYYDYGDQDLYTDEETEETSTTEESIVPSTTRRVPNTVNWRDRIPFYHRRPPVIWNVHLNDNDDRTSGKHEQRRNSGSSLHHSLLVVITMFISRV